MKFIDKHAIHLQRILSDLDLFALDFIKILRKHTTYVLVSGYVSILLGRARASEDIDVIIPEISFETFSVLLAELLSKGFYCLNAASHEEIFSYLQHHTAIRFAKTDTVIPNMELKMAKSRVDRLALETPLSVEVGSETFLVSNLELQIAFKEIVLKSPKDIEDARHLRRVAEGHLDQEQITRYEGMLHDL